MPSDFKNKPGMGGLFINDTAGNDKRPTMKGKATLPDGTEVRVSAWTKIRQNGEKWLSLQIEDMEPQAAAVVQTQTEITPDDDLPF